MTAMLCAVAVIGGLDFGELLKRDKVKEEKDKPGIIAQVMKQGQQAAGPIKKSEQESEGLEDLRDVKSTLETAMDANLAANLPSPDEPLSCVVYGFMKDGKEDFGRILLAAKIHGKPVHVGVIKGEDLPAHVRKNMAARMADMVTTKPVVAPKYYGTWVRPKIGLPISFSGWSINGELMDPEIDRGDSKPNG